MVRTVLLLVVFADNGENGRNNVPPYHTVKSRDPGAKHILFWITEICIPWKRRQKQENKYL
jgi:hypothetical protein